MRIEKTKDIDITNPIEKSNMKKHMKMVKDNFHLPFTEISRILSSIEGSHNNPWRIVGITKNCLIRFKENNFKYKVIKNFLTKDERLLLLDYTRIRHRIQRSHRLDQHRKLRIELFDDQ